MKDEIHLDICNSYGELCNEIDYYNNERYQWKLAKLSPNQYATYLKTGKHPIIEG
ncbi:IS3 family transposase [Tepidanaerobacter syntrophicus]|uniref:IS3 family transposase n=1 Tax=Tepidanaerobacter syntrophicus TaxID=224999 RepID=UPI001BD2D17A